MIYGGTANNVTCVQVNFNVSSGNINANQTLYYNGAPFSTSYQFQVSNSSNAVWTLNGDNLDWVAVDLVQYQWGVLAVQGEQSAFFFSRNNNVSSTILNAEIALLQKEGYTINSGDYVLLNNTAC
jgi:hypothetical protein